MTKETEIRKKIREFSVELSIAISQESMRRAELEMWEKKVEKGWAQLAELEKELTIELTK